MTSSPAEHVFRALPLGDPPAARQSQPSRLRGAVVLPALSRLRRRTPSGGCLRMQLNIHLTEATLGIRIAVYVHRPEAHRKWGAEERTTRDECVVLAILTAGIDAAPFEGGDELRRELLPEPRQLGLRLFDAREDGRVATDQHLARQLPGRLSPDRLDVLEPRGAPPLLIPSPHVRQGNVAEDQAAEALRP